MSKRELMIVLQMFLEIQHALSDLSDMLGGVSMYPVPKVTLRNSEILCSLYSAYQKKGNPTLED